jgi:hypothetical protein
VVVVCSSLLSFERNDGSAIVERDGFCVAHKRYANANVNDAVLRTRTDGHTRVLSQNPLELRPEHLQKLRTRVRDTSRDTAGNSFGLCVHCEVFGASTPPPPPAAYIHNNDGRIGSRRRRTVESRYCGTASRQSYVNVHSQCCCKKMPCIYGTHMAMQ